MTAPNRNILVTSALPYANNSLHLGHLLEAIQTDIWVRFQKQRGHRCLYICASDAHGTPVMLRAEELGISPEQLVEQVREEHIRDLQGFSIEHDNYYSTHSPEVQRHSEAIYQSAREGGFISERDIVQAYDPERQMFLADRYVKGECPKCKAPDQYGDNCENCGATYTPTDLINPISSLSGATPEYRDSKHFFFRLPAFADLLKEWTHSGRLQEQVRNKLAEWLDSGLQEWDISRDEPYFGFQIPNAPGKYFYVWVDAPIGYIGSLENLAQRDNTSVAEYWARESDAELYHFIGKDIINFHCLFWPALLHAAGYRLPTAVYAHGFLTVNGTKMSKSRGTFIKASTYLEHLDADYLRYYFAAKLGPGVDDIDLNLDDFIQRVNSDVVGKLVNIASRCAGFIAKRFDGQLAQSLAHPELIDQFLAESEPIAELYERREYSKAVRSIMALADSANQYIAEHKPWELAKQDGQEQAVQDICSTGIHMFAILMAYLKPVLPATASRAETFLGVELTWPQAKQPIAGNSINAFSSLISRIDPKQVENMQEASKHTLEQAEKKQSGQDASESVSKEISVDEFFKVDLRVAEVINAEEVEGADKLLRLTLNVGDHQRTVFSGIKSAYSPEELIGKNVIVAANLKARKMRFGTSEGMVLAAAADSGEEIFIVEAAGATPGMRVS